MIRATTRDAANEMAEILASNQGATFCVFDDIQRCGSKGRYVIVHALDEPRPALPAELVFVANHERPSP